MVLRAFWTERVRDRLRMNLERMACQIISANFRTKSVDAIQQILKEGKVEETKMSQKWGILISNANADL